VKRRKLGRPICNQERSAPPGVASQREIQYCCQHPDQLLEQLMMNLPMQVADEQSLLGHQPSRPTMELRQLQCSLPDPLQPPLDLWVSVVQS